jgi:hypothetical protein
MLESVVTRVLSRLDPAEGTGPSTVGRRAQRRMTRAPGSAAEPQDRYQGPVLPRNSRMAAVNRSGASTALA